MDATTMEKLRLSRQRLSMAQQFSPQAIAPIRRIVEIHLTLWKAQGVLDRCLAILTELCSNIRHTGDERFELTVSILDSRVRLGVRDYSTVLPVVPGKMPPFEAVSGRGLYVVTSYADQFGMDRLSDGKVIWAEMASGAASNTA
ncbi:ATP-binding protein [Streptosporangium canum]|uniref:ATP-binding protein n=1 Tax=Streptosporangium canum TaxID=324952 RepID=UPI003674A377